MALNCINLYVTSSLRNLLYLVTVVFKPSFLVSSGNKLLTVSAVLK